MPAQQLDTTARKARRILEREGTVTAGALARRLGCTQRHVRRLVEQLEDAGVPVERGYEGKERAFRTLFGFGYKGGCRQAGKIGLPPCPRERIASQSVSLPRNVPLSAVDRRFRPVSTNIGSFAREGSGVPGAVRRGGHSQRSDTEGRCSGAPPVARAVRSATGAPVGHSRASGIV